MKTRAALFLCPGTGPQSRGTGKFGPGLAYFRFGSTSPLIEPEMDAIVSSDACPLGAQAHHGSLRRAAARSKRSLRTMLPARRAAIA